MDLLLTFGGAGVVLLVLCLVVRESTEQRLRRLRAGLMQLRSQVRVLEDRLRSCRTIQSQVREVLSRIDSRKLSTNDAIESIYDDLRELYRLLRDEELPESPAEAQESAPEEVEAQR